MPFNENEWKPNRKQAEFLAIPITIKEGLYGGGNGSGKALALYTKVPTMSGWKTMDTIEVGDILFDEIGKQCSVTEVLPVQYDHNCYELVFDDGSTVVADEEHNWTTLTYNERKNNNRRTKEFREERKKHRESKAISFNFVASDAMALMNANRVHNYLEPIKGNVRTTKEISDTLKARNEIYTNHSITLAEPVISSSPHKLLIDPYVLGAWLGDGSSDGSRFSCKVEEGADILMHIESRGYGLSQHVTPNSWRILGLETYLRRMGLVNNKHIPQHYLRATFEQRLDLLRGLMDTDGTINDSGNCQFSTSLPRLRDNFCELVGSLGIKYFVIQKESYLYGKRCQDAHLVSFTAKLDVFNLTRKLNRQKNFIRQTQYYRYVIAANKVETVPVRCIRVDSPSHQFLITDRFIPTHNTDVLLIYGIAHRWHENSLFKQVFMRRTYKDLKKEVVGRSRELYSRFGATFNATDMVWTFPREDQYGAGIRGNSGAQIFLGHCELEKDVHNYDSMEISLFTPDELTNATEYIYTYIMYERNRSPRGSGLPSITRAAGRPGGVGHTFTKKRFVDPFPEGGKVIVGKGGNKRIYIHATLEDNKDHNDPTYSQSLDGLPEAERQAKKFGNWSAYLGQVFDEFRDKHYPDEPENALHVVEPFDIPEWWPRFVVGDWGFSAMSYVGWFAVSPTKRLYLYRELYWFKTRIAEWAPIVKSFNDQENVKSVKFCRSAAQDRGQEHTIQQQIEEALGVPIDLSSNSAGSRISGKMLLHEYMRWKPKPVTPISEMPSYSEEHAMWLMRNKGIEEYKNYLRLFDPPEEEKNIPRLQIFCCKEDVHEGHPNCCQTMIDTIKACNYDDKPSNGKEAEDVAEFSGDDPYDTLRYACDTADSYFNEAGEEFKRVLKQATLIEQLKNTQDWTAFYRNARTLEASDRIKPVSRFHRK